MLEVKTKRGGGEIPPKRYIRSLESYDCDLIWKKTIHMTAINSMINVLTNTQKRKKACEQRQKWGDSQKGTS